MTHVSCLNIRKNCFEWAERYVNIISNLSFIASMFSSVVDVLRWPVRASSLTSCRLSLSQLCHNWTCVLLIVDSPNVTVNISNVVAHLISFFTENLIQFLWSLKIIFIFWSHFVHLIRLLDSIDDWSKNNSYLLFFFSMQLYSFALLMRWTKKNWLTVLNRYLHLARYFYIPGRFQRIHLSNFIYAILLLYLI